MKKIIAGLFVLLLVASVINPASADYSRARGTITSFDKKKGTIIFQPAKEGEKSFVLKVPKKLDGNVKLKTKFFISFDGRDLKTIREDKGIVIPVGCGSGS